MTEKRSGRRKREADPVPTEVVEILPGGIVEATYQTVPERKPWVLISVVILSILGVVAMAVTYMGTQQTRITNQQDRLTRQENSQRLYDQIVEMGASPAGDNPKSTSPGEVSLERGQRGFPGKDGEEGVKGEDGAPGADGVPGADGRNATDEQVVWAVTNYCAANGGCRGSAGRDGQDGAPGAPGAPGNPGIDGRGIGHFECGVRDLIVHYTDGTSQSLPVRCTG